MVLIRGLVENDSSRAGESQNACFAVSRQATGLKSARRAMAGYGSIGVRSAGRDIDAEFIGQHFIAFVMEKFDVTL